jgi:hypothetical protein
MALGRSRRPAPAVAYAFKERTSTVQFDEEARALLSAALAEQGMTHGELSQALAEIGAPISEAALTNKIARGGFSAAFLLRCVDALGLKLEIGRKQ